MPWNEPGNSSNNKDPWTGRPRQTPPDLEAFLRDLLKKIVALFKLKANHNNKAFVKAFVPTHLNARRIGLLLGFLILAWLGSGFFVLDPYEQAVVTRFGKYQTTLSSGRHWIFKPFETRYVIPEKAITVPYQTDLMTRDANKVTVSAKIHYALVNARQFIFSNTQTLQSLQGLTARAVQQVLGNFSLKQLLNADPIVLQHLLQVELNTLLSKYTAGLAVSDIELQALQVPHALQASFEDLAHARSEKEQLENQARIAATQTVLDAKSRAEHLLMDAKTYQQETILRAKAETTRFLALLPAYEASPALTRKRLFADMLQTVMPYSNKMLINDPATIALYLNANKEKPIIEEHPKATIPTTMATDTTLAATSVSSLGEANALKTKQGEPSSYGTSGGYE